MLTKEIVEKLIRAGMAAPSGDNLQPWKFYWDKKKCIYISARDIEIDKSLFNILYKNQKIAFLMAIGAVLENMRICADYLKYNTDIVYFPEKQEKERCIVNLTFSKNKYFKKNLSCSLYSTIFKRCANRKKYKKKFIDFTIQKKSQKEIKSFNGIKLHWIKDTTKIKEIAKLVRATDKIMFETKGILSPLMKSIRWTKEEREKTQDGLPIESLELNTLEQRSFCLFSFWPIVKILNYIGLSVFASHRSLALVNNSGSIGLLTLNIKKKGDLVGYIQAGEAFEKIWLYLTSCGLSFQPLAGIGFLIMRLRLINGEGLSQLHISQIKHVKERLYNIFNLKKEEIPIMLFRTGYSSSPSCQSLRYDLETCFDIF